jgi:UDP-N-acetylmuramate--alanine ligase
VTDPPLDLSVPRRIHLVAIGGKAMSPIAQLLQALGHRVTGSDLHDSTELQRLRALGIEVRVGHDPVNLGDADLVACSTAVPDDNIERRAALERGIPVVGRPVLQGALAALRRVVAVSGTHGKSTTTAMLATIGLEAGIDPSYLVGATMVQPPAAARLGAGEWFVIEADESDGTFLQLGADIAVVTNLGADHLDRWGSLDTIEEAFDRFLAQASTARIVNADDAVAARLGRRHGAITVGTGPDTDWRLVDLRQERGRIAFALHHGGDVHSVAVSEPGLYNAFNAASAIAAAASMGIDAAVAVRALAAYAGLERRFQTLGEAGGVTVVDDYAHNPDKVAAVLAAAAHGGWQRVVAVFQPHRYSRTADLWPLFADSFVDADLVVITELDPSDEPVREGISGVLVADAVRSAHPDAPVLWVPDRSRVVADIARLLEPGDVCLTLGAGDVTEFGPELLRQLGERTR